MYFKQLINSKEEFFDFVWQFIEAKLGGYKIWKDEDLPLLKPFFDHSSKSIFRKMNKEETESFKQYKRICGEYADKRTELRDAVANIELNNLCSALFIKEIETECWDYNENGDEIDEEGNIVPPISKDALEFDEEISFPLILVGTILSDFDRAGDVSLLFVNKVELKDFA